MDSTAAKFSADCTHCMSSAVEQEQENEVGAFRRTNKGRQEIQRVRGRHAAGVKGLAEMDKPCRYDMSGEYTYLVDAVKRMSESLSSSFEVRPAEDLAVFAVKEDF